MDAEEKFFYRQGGYGVGPGETEAQARKRGARNLAAAEREAERRGYRVEWREDENSWADVQSDLRAGHREEGETPKEILYAVLYDADDRALGSLGGIEDPSRDYGRVVEAELALEALTEGGWEPPSDRAATPKKASGKKASGKQVRATIAAIASDGGRDYADRAGVAAALLAGREFLFVGLGGGKKKVGGGFLLSEGSGPGPLVDLSLIDEGRLYPLAVLFGRLKKSTTFDARADVVRAGSAPRKR